MALPDGVALSCRSLGSGDESLVVVRGIEESRRPGPRNGKHTLNEVRAVVNQRSSNVALVQREQPFGEVGGILEHALAHRPAVLP
jgi:hypothetical protein